MSLHETLASIKAGAKERLPAEALSIMAQATEELQNSGLVEKALGTGQTVPDVTLETSEGAPFNLKEQLDKGPLILTFFRGSW